MVRWQAAKAYKKAPFMIADEVVEKLSGSSMFEKIESVKPGFININISAGYLADFVNSMSEKEKFGYEPEVTNKTVIVDYGGANAGETSSCWTSSFGSNRREC